MSGSNFAKEYNPDTIEQIIDAHRLEENWTDVVSCLERYAHIFDSGTSVGTKQHPDLKRVKAYYWVVMAEYLYKYKSDFISAIDCLRRAMSIDEKYVDVKIVCSSMLLHKTKPLLTSTTTTSERHNSIDRDAAAAAGVSEMTGPANSHERDGAVEVEETEQLADFSLDLSFIMGASYHVSWM